MQRNACGCMFVFAEESFATSEIVTMLCFGFQLFSLLMWLPNFGRACVPLSTLALAWSDHQTLDTN